MARRFSAVSYAALTVGLFIAGGQAGAQSLEDELAVLLRDSPEINSLRNQAQAADEGIEEAYAGYLPSLLVTGDTGGEYTNSPGTRATGTGNTVGLWRTKIEGTLRQRLFDGYGTDATYNSALLNSELAGLTLEATAQSLALDGIRAYLDVLRSLALIDLATRNVAVIQTQLDLETERVIRGTGITLDELQAKTRLQIAQERRVAFEGMLQQAIARYNRLFGHYPDLGAMARPAIPMGELPATLEDAIAIASAEHPSIVRGDVGIEIADQSRTAARSVYYPTIDLVGRLRFENDVDGIQGSRRDGRIVVEATWELFNGFAHRAGVARSAFEYVAAVHDRAAAGRLVSRDVELAWEQLTTSRQRVDLLENAVAIAEEVHAARVRLRDAGQETVLNVLDAQNDVFNAQINLVGAEYDGYLAVYRMLQAMGRLTPERLGVAGVDMTSRDIAPADFALAATADAHTVALASAPEPEVAGQPAEAPTATAAVPAEVEIVAASQAIAWPLPEPEASAAAETGALEPATVTDGADDPAVSRSWSFD